MILKHYLVAMFLSIYTLLHLKINMICFKLIPYYDFRLQNGEIIYFSWFVLKTTNAHCQLWPLSLILLIGKQYQPVSGIPLMLNSLFRVEICFWPFFIKTTMGNLRTPGKYYRGNSSGELPPAKSLKIETKKLIF